MSRPPHSIAAHLPDAFVDRLEAIVGAQRLPAVLSTFGPPARVGFRFNPLVAPPTQSREALTSAGIAFEPVSWYADAATVDADDRDALLATPQAESGAVYLQNLSSMVPPLVLDPRPDERILDQTAAPGSKTLQLAALMGELDDDAELVAVEVVKPRFYKLKANLASGGAPHVRTYLQDGMKVGRYRPEHFDAVLLDAPCSTEGRFRWDEPGTFAYWSERKVAEMARKQKRLLAAGLDALRPGGVLVYSTCSFAPEENEAVVAQALADDDRLSLDPITVDVPAFSSALGEWQGQRFEGVANARRIVPDGTFEGFFVARIRKAV